MTSLLAQVPFPNRGWLTNPRTHERMVDYAIEHMELTLLSVALGLAIAFPLAVLSMRRRRLQTPLLALTGIIYTVPSVAMFIFIAFVLGFGLGTLTAVTGLALYSLIILYRNTLVALTSVPSDALEAGLAMGHSKRQLLWRIQAPLALPVILAGLRIATVTTVGLVTITALFGRGGLGTFFIVGVNRRDPTILVVAVLLVVALAVVLDLAILAARRLALPWARGAGT